jgi:hypothetical protein
MYADPAVKKQLPCQVRTLPGEGSTEYRWSLLSFLGEGPGYGTSALLARGRSVITGSAGSREIGGC